MNASLAAKITPADGCWPGKLEQRLGRNSPPELTALGNAALLASPLTALFCSARCPGEAILRAYDQAAHWRDTGRAVIGGFHAPLERECLRILLRGPQPVVVCPARGLPRRLTPELRAPFLAGRLLLVTPFPESERRVTRALAERRNEIVAAVADEVWFAHIAPGGQMARLAQRVAEWAGREPSAPP